MKTSLNYSTKLFLLFCCISLSGMKCKKDELGLPPITQTGANKLGFLLNGQPWTRIPVYPDSTLLTSLVNCSVMTLIHIPPEN